MDGQVDDVRAVQGGQLERLLPVAQAAHLLPEGVYRVEGVQVGLGEPQQARAQGEAAVHGPDQSAFVQGRADVDGGRARYAARGGRHLCGRQRTAAGVRQRVEDRARPQHGRSATDATGGHGRPGPRPRKARHMKLVRLGDPGRERPAVIDDRGDTRDLSPSPPTSTPPNSPRTASPAPAGPLSEGALPVLETDGLRFGPPVARPGAVVCIGQNYAAHAAESGSEPPARPIIFLKPPNTVVGPHDQVEIPRGSTKTDWAVELAVVIGRTARYLDNPQQALQHVAGYAVSNDVSERTSQLEHSGGQWSKGKSCATFNPLGPYLVAADEVPDIQNLRLRSSVNGEARQDSRTADMIFSVAQLVHDLSHYMVLDPGDIINTGTPQGVALSGRFPYLRPGDVMEIEVEGLGRQRQTLRSV